MQAHISLLALMEFADEVPHLNIELEGSRSLRGVLVPVLPVLPSCVDRLRSFQKWGLAVHAV